MPVDSIPLTLPVSLRTGDDPASGNRFTGVTIAAPIGESDPVERMKQIREQVIARRSEPAIDMIGRLAPVLTLLPDDALHEVFDRITPADIQASNVPGYAQETFLAGAKVDRQYALGPMPRVGMMAVLVSRAGTCTVTCRYDTASFTASDQLEKCLQAGFDEIVELGRPPTRSASKTTPGAEDGQRAADPGPADLMTTPSRQLRLPGSVAEVDASPEGPKIGAFFDLDGTLVAGFTVAAVTKDRLRRREVGATEFLHMMQLAVEYRLGRNQFENVIEGAVRSTKGRLAEDVEEMGERIFRQSVADLIYPEMRELVRAHQRRGHTVVLSSSALSMQAEPVARYLGIGHVVCNRLVINEAGVLTGEIVRPVIWGPSKATSVQRFAAEHQVDLRSSYFYADGDEDVSLMHLVGNPRPINPGPELAKVAARRGWPVLRFSSRGGGGPPGAARSLASIGSLWPVAAGALSLGLLTRNKRTGVNFLTRYWPETVLALNGVQLNIIGEKNLTAPRPAVFLFNHRNNFDIFAVAALVKENWTAVAKKELESNPLIGPLGKLLDTAFIDRADSASAVAALKPIEEAARKGLSIVVAPEGTRMDTQSVGPFKKGAFRIAMATGLPIVPIVIRNSESVAGRNSTTFHPGTVDVAVLPPVSTADWTLANLSERIEQVRASYVALLADWPAAGPAS